MRILLLTPDLPYPSESGAAIRNIGFIRGLAAAGRRVTVLSFSERPPAPEANPLFRLCEDVHIIPLPQHGKLKRIIKLLLSGDADLENRLASAEYMHRLRKLLDDEAFDLIQFSGIELGCYLHVIRARRRDAKLVYDALNAEAELQRVVAQVDRRRLTRLPAALYSSMQTARLTRFESAICRGVDAVIAVSDEDRAFIAKHGGAPVHVIPNGIAVAEYTPPPGARREPQLLLFTGKMDYRPNVDAVEWFHSVILPRVRARAPQAKLVIVGRNPHRRLQALANESGIRVTGWVDSVQPYLHRATIFVAPLRMGSGTRLKILQAMAAGCAVVSTSIGAAGLNEELRNAIVIVDDAEGFADAIVSLLGDGDRRRELGKLAQETVTRHYDWSALTPRLLRLYSELGLG